MSRTRTTAWNLVFHYASFLLVVVSGIVMVPLYLAHIPASLYGGWLAASNVLMWITVVDPGISTIVMQRVATAYGARDSNAIYALSSGGILLAAASGLLVIVAGELVAPRVAEWVRLSDDASRGALKEAFLIAVCGSALTVTSYTFTAIGQGLQSTFGVGIVFLVASIASLVSTAWLVLRGYGLSAIAVGFVIRGAMLLLGNAIYLYWRFRWEFGGFQFSANKVRELFSVSRFQLLSQAGNVIGNQIESIVVARAFGPEVVTTFVLSKRGPDTLRMIAERPSVAFMPAIAHVRGAGDLSTARNALARLTRYVVWVSGLLMGGFAAFNDDFVRLWVGSQFFVGHGVNAIFCGGVFVLALSRSFSNYYQALGGLKESNIAIFLESVLCMGFMLVGATYFGLAGVALAPIVAASAISGWYFPKRVGRLLGVERAEALALLREMVVVTIIAVIIAAGAALLRPDGWMAFSLQVVSFSCLYAIALFIFSEGVRSECRAVLRIAP